jgi:HSP20 family molecular chaperone IbpA
MFPRTFIGFESLLSDLDRLVDRDSFPPYNIIQTDENRWAIELAVAGFRPEDLEVQADRSYLTVSSVPPAADEPRPKYLHHGIARRRFSQRFRLGEHIRVEGASLNNGILRLDLVREIPEDLRPRRIDIVSRDA